MPPVRRASTALPRRRASHASHASRTLAASPNGAGEPKTAAPGERLAGVLGPLDATLDLSIVIVNWNTQVLLRQCLTSILKDAEALHVELIVVDNASRDSSVAMVRREFPDARLLVNGRNVGFARANNQAMRHAHGRYVMLLNSDTIVRPGALAVMVRYMDGHPAVGALGPRLLNGDGTVQPSAHPFPDVARDTLRIASASTWSLLRRLSRRPSSDAALPASVRTGPVDWLVGACLVVRREAIEGVGVLDEGYFFGNEEVDLALRLRQHGWRNVYLDEAEVVHLGSQSWLHMTPTRVVWFYTGRLRYFRLHYSPWQRLIQRLAIAAVALSHIIPLVARRCRSSDDQKRLSAFAHVLARAVADR